MRRIKKVTIKHLWKKYVFQKQTKRELASDYSMDKRTIRSLFEKYKPPQKRHNPRPVHIVTDATYFGERTEDTSWCVAVARDPSLKENLVWRFADTETTSLYSNLKDQLERAGYVVVSITADGFGGIRSAFTGIPYQMCHVHMERLVVRGTTKNPKTEAGEVLLALVRTLHNTNSHVFNTRLKMYIEKYNTFLNEKTTNP